jgi:hypothetical protein
MQKDAISVTKVEKIQNATQYNHSTLLFRTAEKREVPF